MLRSVLLVCALAGTATADAEEPSPHPMSRLSLGIGAMVQGGTLAGLDLGAWGGNVEVAVGTGRWQSFGEVGLSFVRLGPAEDHTSGRRLRGGIGVRWLARAFELGSKGAIEMYLEGFTGWSRYQLEDRARLSQPDLGLGVGYGIRSFFGHRFRGAGLRVSARVVFAPTDRRDEEIACRGTCPTGDRSSGGLMAVFGGQL